MTALTHAPARRGRWTKRLGADLDPRGWLDRNSLTPGAVAPYLILQCALGSLLFFYWGEGPVRGAVLVSVLAALVWLRFRYRPPERVAAAEPSPVVRVVLMLALAANLGLAVFSTAHCLKTGRIAMDEGETSWRAANMLVHHQNPYGLGALTDLSAYTNRAGARAALNAPALPAGPMALRAAATGKAATELHMYGYKYGPMLILLTALFLPFGTPAIVMALNAAATFGLFAVLWKVFRKIAGAQAGLAAIAIAAVLLDRNLTRSYIGRSATDVWALLFGSIAVLCSLSRRPMATAAALAMAVGFKIVPAVLFLPLLFKTRRPEPIILFVSLVALIYGPWLMWDAGGVFDNIVLWPATMTANANSWVYFAAPVLVDIVRVGMLGVIGLAWCWELLGRRSRPFWTMALSNTAVLLCTGYFANNYIPWISIWAVAAILESQVARSSVSGAIVQNPSLETTLKSAALASLTTLEA